MKVTIIPIVIGGFGTVTKGLLKSLEDLGVETIQTTAIIENDQNTEKSPGDLRILAVTQSPVKDHQLTLMWKTLMNNNNDNNNTCISYPRDDLFRVYVLRREGGRGLASIEDSVDASIQRLEDYKQKRGWRLIAATTNNAKDSRTSGTTITRKQKWDEKQIYGRFKWLTSTISSEKTWTWLGKRKP